MPRLDDLLSEVAVTIPRRAIAQAIDLVVHIRRTADGRRVDAMIAVEPGDPAGTYALSPIR